MRLLVNLIFIILFFVLLNSIFSYLIPTYRNYLSSAEEKNKVENELLETKAIEEQFKFLQSNEIADILKIKKSGFLEYFLPSKFIDYELTIFINQLFFLAGFKQPNIYSFNKEEIVHPEFKKAKLTKFSFSFSDKSDFNSLLKLINTLENSSRIFDIESLSLKRSAEGNNIEFTFKASTYYFLP
ncbi:MAG: hypothetical protein NZ866_01945 [Patescibacteria group bacterium]|nr:hypothetical protein [Patescibacteria group bacterium]